MKFLLSLVCLAIIANTSSLIRERTRGFFAGRDRSSGGLFGGRPEHRRRLLENLCITQSGATEGDLAPLRNNTLPDQRAARCFLACMQRFLGLQTPEGAPTLQGIAASFSSYLEVANPTLHKQILNVMVECGTQAFFSNTTDSCDRAYEISACAAKEGFSNVLGLMFGMNSTAV